MVVASSSQNTTSRVDDSENHVPLTRIEKEEVEEEEEKEEGVAVVDSVDVHSNSMTTQPTTSRAQTTVPMKTMVATS